jgi:hypothetical protein
VFVHLSLKFNRRRPYHFFSTMFIFDIRFHGQWNIPNNQMGEKKNAERANCSKILRLYSTMKRWKVVLSDKD